MDKRRSGQRPNAPGQKPSSAKSRGGKPARPAHRGGCRDDAADAADAPDRSSRPYLAPPPSGHPSAPMRIARAMARAGLCSRRDAERWIGDGRVTVNGRVIASPALDVSPADTVLVDGRPLPDSEPVKLWRYHKPRGLVTTPQADPQGRENGIRPLSRRRWAACRVGGAPRLSTPKAYLLLTTNGALARHLELPSDWLDAGVIACGRTAGSRKKPTSTGLRRGVTEIDGVHYGPVEATHRSRRREQIVWLGMLSLREGKNREVRTSGSPSICSLTVNRLIRVSFGPFAAAAISRPKCAVEEVKRRVLADQLGPKPRRVEFGAWSLADEAAAPRHSVRK